MLRNIPSLLGPELLFALRAMGHGDEIVIVDANFPGKSMNPNCIRVDGANADDVLRAVLSVLPVDTFVDDPLTAMKMVDTAEKTPPTVRGFQKIVDAVADVPSAITLLDRFAFYERTKHAFAVIQTSDMRPYGNLIIKKGVIADWG